MLLVEEEHVFLLLSQCHLFKFFISKSCLVLRSIPPPLSFLIEFIGHNVSCLQWHDSLHISEDGRVKPLRYFQLFDDLEHLRRDALKFGLFAEDKRQPHVRGIVAEQFYGNVNTAEEAEKIRVLS